MAWDLNSILKMQTSLLHNHDPKNDYRLIIDTPPAIHKKVAALKSALDRDYKGMVIAGGNPFIYLATFSQRESREQEMADVLNLVAIGFMPFKLHLKNFGHIDNREIYIGIEEAETLQYLVSRVKAVAQSLPGLRLNEMPRMTLAQRLHPWQFEKSWPQYEQKHFAATFLADQMLLLKRMEGFRSWQVLKHMEFQNQFTAI